MKIFNYIIEVKLHARHKWTHMKLHRYGSYRYTDYRHFVWGKLSIIFGQPHLIEIEVCNYCSEAVTGMGEDGISVCDEGGCGIVEGHTRYITTEEYEGIYN